MTENAANGLSRRDFLKRATISAIAISVTAFAANGRSDCRTWKVGTTTRLSATSSADQFRQLRMAGLEVVELEKIAYWKQLPQFVASVSSTGTGIRPNAGGTR